MWDHLIALTDMERESAHLWLHCCFTVTSGWICRRLAVGRSANLKHYTDMVLWVWVLLCRSAQMEEEVIQNLARNFQSTRLSEVQFFIRKISFLWMQEEGGKELLWSAFLKTPKSWLMVFKIPLKKLLHEFKQKHILDFAMAWKNQLVTINIVQLLCLRMQCTQNIWSCMKYNQVELNSCFSGSSCSKDKTREARCVCDSLHWGSLTHIWVWMQPA